MLELSLLHQLELVVVAAALVILLRRVKSQFKFERLLRAHQVDAEVTDYAKEQSSTDLLENTLHALRVTSLADRASKLGSFTLRNLWRLNNPFVSSSADVQNAYRSGLVRTFNKTSSEAWTDIARTVAKAIQPHLYTIQVSTRNYTSANIKNISRDVSLAAVLKGLFNIDDVPPEQLTYIGTEIHRLTVGKKQYDAGASKPDYLPTDLQAAADRLIDNLRGLFSGAVESSPLAKHLLCEVSGTPDDFNPLNLVIPAFEAPWRATYYTMLAILQRGPQQSANVATLRNSNPATPPSQEALAIAYESLRLYPPIRRVRRNGRVDIEIVQRATQYWGEDATDFDPTRFLDGEGRIKNSMIAQGSAWMPFAIGPMRCPSASGYSTRLLTVIVGELLRQLFPEGEKLEWSMVGTEWDTAAGKGEPLRSGREEYGNVRVIIPT